MIDNTELITATTSLVDVIAEVKEKLRLTKLFSLKILDTDPEQAFNDVVNLASHICETPIAAIIFIDEHRAWVKAKVGPISLGSSPREISFCNHAINETKPMIVTDATKVKLFVNNPLVIAEPFIRFYAGVPLITSTGEALGALCVVDQKPRCLNEEQILQLTALGRLTLELVYSKTKS